LFHDAVVDRSVRFVDDVVVEKQGGMDALERRDALLPARRIEARVTFPSLNMTSESKTLVTYHQIEISLACGKPRTNPQRR
jgi:hypothetical protein